MKRLFSVLLIAVMLVSFLPATMLQADAATANKGGTCGANLYWTLSSTGTLTISGKGAMYDYSAYNSPFSDYDVRYYTKAIVVKSGVTSIGDHAFYYSDATSISLPSTLKTIGDMAFWGCNSLTSVSIPSSVTQIGYLAFFACDRLAKIHFAGNAPAVNSSFPVTADVYYSPKNSGWTDAVKKNCESFGDLTWHPVSGATFTQSAKAVVLPGKTASVTVKATGKDLKYYWYFANKNATKFSYTSSFKGNTYSIAMNSARDGRRVYCKIVDFYGNAVYTKAVTLKIGPKITQQPVSVKAPTGTTETVKVAATGDGLTYKWYFANPGSSKFYYTSSFKSNTYSIKMDAAKNGRRVYCIVTDQYGNAVKSNVATLQRGPAITVQPQNVTVVSGKTAAVKLTAKGEGLTYKWYFANSGSSKFYYTSSFKGNSYSIAMNAARNGRKVYCVVTDKYGVSVKSNVVTLGMNTIITAQPTNVSAANGKAATVRVGTTGTGLTYKWYFANPGSSKFYYTSSFKSNKYSVAMSDARDGRRVYCVITNASGKSEKTDVVTLSMSPKITKQPTNVCVASGKTGTTRVTATGEGLTYKWYFAEKGSSKFNLTNSFKSNSYSIVMNDARNGRRAYCVITDKYGNSTKTNTVTFGTAVKISSQPSDVTVSNGSTASVSFTATGHGLTYKWYYKDSGSSAFSYASGFTGNKYSATMSGSVDGRQVYCVVTDMFGKSVYTDTVTLNKSKSIVGSWRSTYFIDLEDSSNDMYSTSGSAHVYNSGSVYLYTPSGSQTFTIQYWKTNSDGSIYYRSETNLVLRYDPYKDEMEIRMNGTLQAIYFERM